MRTHPAVRMVVGPLRDVATAPRKSTETVRISAAHRREQEEQSDERVPLVRLHEEAEDDAEATARLEMPLALPPRPAGVEARLPVVPLPDLRAGKAASGSATSPDAEARERYRLALRSVQARNFERAGDALAAFLDAYPAHALSDGATYWLGEGQERVPVIERGRAAAVSGRAERVSAEQQARRLAAQGRPVSKASRR